MDYEDPLGSLVVPMGERRYVRVVFGDSILTVGKIVRRYYTARDTFPPVRTAEVPSIGRLSDTDSGGKMSTFSPPCASSSVPHTVGTLSLDLSSVYLESTIPVAKGSGGTLFSTQWTGIPGRPFSGRVTSRRTLFVSARPGVLVVADDPCHTRGYWSGQWVDFGEPSEEPADHADTGSVSSVTDGSSSHPAARAPAETPDSPLNVG